MMMRVAGPIKLQMKYVSNLSQHLHSERARAREKERDRGGGEILNENYLQPTPIKIKAISVHVLEKEHSHVLF